MTAATPHDDSAKPPDGKDDASVIHIADLVLEVSRQRACRAGKPLALTAIDLRLLTALVLDAGRPVSRSALAELVWQRPRTDGSNVVDVGICRLRTKVDGPFERKLIHAVRGVGYLCADQP